MYGATKRFTVYLRSIQEQDYTEKNVAGGTQLKHLNI